MLSMNFYLDEFYPECMYHNMTRFKDKPIYITENGCSCIGQFSKFIRPGAVRIGLSSYTSMLETTAFMNTDGSIAAVIYNTGNCEIKYILRIHGMLLERTALPYSVETVIFKNQL